MIQLLTFSLSTSYCALFCHDPKNRAKAHHSALTKHDEFVVEALVSNDKLGVLVHELLLVEVWKEKVAGIVPLLLM